MTGTQGQGELLATAKARPIQNALINSYPDAMPDAILDLMSDTNSKGAASMKKHPNSASSSRARSAWRSLRK